MKRTRRQFLKTTAGAAGTLAALGRSARAREANRASSAPPSRSKNILVVLQLSGGNDGLNTVVPFTDPVYIKSRPTLHLKPGQVLPFSDKLGFHPTMKGFLQMYRERRLTILQDVGCPAVSQDHAKALRTWQTAEPDDPICQTGWLGRTADRFNERHPFLTSAVFVGDIAIPFTLHSAKAIIPAVRKPADLCLLESYPFEYYPGGQRSAPLSGWHLLHSQLKNAYGYTNRLSQAIAERAGQHPPAAYPPFALADRLRTVARLIRADTGIRIYHTELGGDGFGGFDNHAGQAENHAALLKQLSESVAAFCRDLAQDRWLDRVILMTFSEFGRTVHENGRKGTGHGSAAPLFLAGGKLKGGMVGGPSNLSKTRNDGLACQFDFRQVYATMLKDWLGVDPAGIIAGDHTVIPGLFA